jgi:hypothetical protein
MLPPSPIPLDLNAEDTTRKYVDILRRVWYRHKNGAIYCQGRRVLDIVDTEQKTVVVTANSSMDVMIAAELHRKWNEEENHPSIVPPMDVRDVLKVQRRTAFIELLQTTELTTDIDDSLDRFFKAGIELERRKRENG